MLRLHKPILTQRGAFGPVMALSPAAWYRPGIGVTGTLTASNWADQSGNGRDLAQGTAGNQPIYLPYSGTAYAYIPSVNGNWFSTPDSAAADIVGDLDIRFKVAMNDWTPSAAGVFGGKWLSSGGLAYCLLLETTGVLTFYWSADGSTPLSRSSTVATGLTDAAESWIRATIDVDNGAAGYDVKFYTSSDGVAWTQLGTTVTVGGVTSIFSGNGLVSVGATDAGSTNLLPAAKMYRMQIYNGIDGTLAVDFNPSTFAETSTNGATAVASTGETWTLNSTGAKPAQIVKSASLLFDGTDDYMAAAFALGQPNTIYLVGKQISWTLNDSIWTDTHLSQNMWLAQNASSPDIKLYAGGFTDANTGWTVGSKAIITGVLNGASSLTQVNAGTAATGDSGAGVPAGICLAGLSGGFYANLQAWELIIFSAAHTAAQRASVQQWLALRHAISL